MGVRRTVRELDTQHGIELTATHVLLDPVERYRIELDDGAVPPTQVWGPEDTDQFVRARPGAAK